MLKKLAMRGLGIILAAAAGFVYGTMVYGSDAIDGVLNMWGVVNHGGVYALLVLSWALFALCGFAVGGLMSYLNCADIVDAAEFELARTRHIAREARGILQPETAGYRYDDGTASRIGGDGFPTDSRN